MTLEMILSKQVCDLKHRIETLEGLLGLKLPVDVTFNGCTHKADTTLRALAFRIKAFNEVQEHIKSLDVEDVRRKLSEVR